MNFFFKLWSKKKITMLLLTLAVFFAAIWDDTSEAKGRQLLVSQKVMDKAFVPFLTVCWHAAVHPGSPGRLPSLLGHKATLSWLRSRNSESKDVSYAAPCRKRGAVERGSRVEE